VTKVEVHLYPKGGAAAVGGIREFDRVPAVGEVILALSGERFVVTDILWLANGTAQVIASFQPG
jgi:hypothetical protein